MANPENKQIPYESTQKDIRDAIESVATAIGGITHPDAEDIVYDNSVSGLSATDVQNALDEIVSDIPTVNNGTLTIQQNGTSISSFSANTASNVTANIKTPTADKKTATSEFSTANGGLLSKCQINLVPVQSGSGDPSPDNVRPISGHTEVDLLLDGKNLFDVKTLVQKPWNGNTTNLQRVRPEHCLAFPISTKITVSFDSDFVSTYNYSILQLPTDFPADSITTETGWVNTNSTTITTVATYIGINIKRHDGNDIDLADLKSKKIMVEFGETATPYEPYLGNLYQVQIGSTVYGGYDEIVGGSGKGTLKGIDLGSLTFYYDAPIFLSNEQLTDADLPPSNQDTIDGLCECYKVVARSSIANNQIAVSRVGRVVIYDSRYTDPTDIQNYVSGKKFVYKLATPTDITTTPQQIEALPNQNNLSTPLSGQSIETDGVEYKELFTFADVLALDAEKVDISAIGTDESGRTTASRAYIKGEHFCKDGKFCTALVNIASGATFTLGTNYAEGTVSDNLTALERGILSSTGVWSGDTLTFNIPKANIYLYKLSALSVANGVESLYIVRNDGTIVKKDFGESTSGTYTDSKLVITLPNNHYWLYKFELIKNTTI